MGELHPTFCLHLNVFPNRIVTFDRDHDEREGRELAAAAA